MTDNSQPETAQPVARDADGDVEINTEKDTKVYKRYYHVFYENELEKLLEEVKTVLANLKKKEIAEKTLVQVKFVECIALINLT